MEPAIRFGAQPMPKEQTGRGVYFEMSDYAGMWRRLVGTCADIISLLVFWMILGTVWFLLYPDRMFPYRIAFWIGLASAYFYLVILKRSRYRTLGYWIAGVRIVDLQGQRPSVLTMSVRFLMLFVLPYSLILDIVWLTGEGTRQTLRDKWIGTYVVRRKAQPAGTGTQQVKRMSLLGLHLVVREVKPDV